MFSDECGREVKAKFEEIEARLDEIEDTMDKIILQNRDLEAHLTNEQITFIHNKKSILQT